MPRADQFRPLERAREAGRPVAPTHEEAGISNVQDETAETAAPPDSRLANAMTVDVEDYFQVSAFERHFPREEWDRIPCRVEGNVDRVLALFERKRARATFFLLGWIAERYPQVVRRIEAQGHEIASHGYFHIRATEQSVDEFRQEAQYTKRLLEDITGVAVRGYRAPSFSIDTSNLWTLRVLKEVGYSYSSSIYPVQHDHYGMPDAPRFPFEDPDGGVLEIPVTTVRLLERNLPVGGGGYFRLFPYVLSRWALRRVNRREGRPVVFYFHPWELDPDQPRPEDLSLKTRFRHYVNLARTERRLESLLGEFRWCSMAEVYLHNHQGSSRGSVHRARDIA